MIAFLPIAEIQRFAEAVPPPQMALAILVAAALLCAVSGLLSARSRLLAWLPGAIYVGAGAAALWFFMAPDARGPRIAAIVVAAVGLIVAVVTGRGAEESADDSETGSQARSYLIALLLIAGFLLFYDLGGYSGSLVAWEAPVAQGFADAYVQGQSLLAYLAQRFLWDDGILSAGHTSLFYGAPTYALFHVAGFSQWTLRLFAAVATLFSIGIIYLLARRFFGAVAAGAVAVVFALNPAVLYYGRYGSSPAGTILAVLLALLLTWLFLARRRSAWWLAPLCALGLFAATLQYAPARLVVLVLLGVIVLVSVLQWRHIWWQRLLGLIVIGIAVAAVWQVQTEHRRAHYFVHARGETFLEMVNSPGQMKSLVGRDLLDRQLRPGPPSMCEKVELGAALVRGVTLPQYLHLVSPDLHPALHGDVIRYDPPDLPLYHAPVVLFIVWGAAVSVSRIFSWPHACLLIWFALTTPPLLLTNRVDAHRTLLFVIPFSLWAAIGVREAARVMRESRLPAAVGHVIAALLVATLVLSNFRILYYPSTPEPRLVDVMNREVMSIRGPVWIGWDWDHRDVGLLQLRMLERMRREPDWKGLLLPEAIRINVKNEGKRSPSEVYIRDLYNMMDSATVLLAPAERYREAAAALQRRGARVAERGTDFFRIIRIDRGEAATGVPDRAIEPLPTIVIPPTPTPIPLGSGPQVSLTTLPASEVEFGFAEPRLNRAWNGPPISLGGVQYERGIGMHAPTRMEFEVPEGAVQLQAIVGLADTIGDCPKAAVTFEVRNERDELLYGSGLVDPATPPKPIRVDLRGARTIALVLTDAGNGIDCDHGNWAEPSFLLGTSGAGHQQGGVRSPARRKR